MRGGARQGGPSHRRYRSISGTLGQSRRDSTRRPSLPIGTRESRFTPRIRGERALRRLYLDCAVIGLTFVAATVSVVVHAAGAGQHGDAVGAHVLAVASAVSAGAPDAPAS